MHDCANISPVSPLCENAMIPNLGMIIDLDECSLELLCLPQKWCAAWTLDFRQLIWRYSAYLVNRGRGCECGQLGCAKYCEGEGAKTPGPWVVQNPMDFPRFKIDVILKK
jgi:hypothetical protein